ncbi:hypothetical protein ACEZCY_22495 [Streptacidiphilus sp. N1-12]|uniref:Uncharacterized protein n=2 Tax=Streptacidiphilus alkalitolerans TaxID=3342712 RepID=A0ABV6WIU8_9ACTN
MNQRRNAPQGYLDLKPLMQRSMPNPSLTAALRALVTHMRAEQILFYDDTWRGIPQFQHSLIPSTIDFERAVLPAAAASAVIDSVAICRRLPAPPEMARARSLTGSHSFRVLALSGGRWVNVGALDQEDHWKRYAAQQAGVDLPGPDDSRIPELLSWLSSTRQTLFLPYQTLDYHYRCFGDQVLLCDPADRLNDKAFVARTLVDAGLRSQVPDGILVRPTDPDTYVHNIIEAVDIFAARDMASYIKLSQRGVSGLANVVPSQDPVVYEISAPHEARITRMRQILSERRIDSRQETATIDERLPKGSDEMGPREFTVGGLLVDGDFYPCYVGRNVNSPTDATNRMIHSNTSELVGLDDSTYQRIIGVAACISEALVGIGYRTGYSYIDVIITTDGRIVATDFNMRRGLRSAGEAWISRYNGAFYTKTFDVGSAITAPSLRTLADHFSEIDVVWYGTPAPAASPMVSVIAPMTPGACVEALDASIGAVLAELAGPPTR